MYAAAAAPLVAVVLAALLPASRPQARLEPEPVL
jgi:hypothetical protein